MYIVQLIINKTYWPFSLGTKKLANTSQQARTHAGLINDLVRTRHHNIIKTVSLVYGIPHCLLTQTGI